MKAFVIAVGLLASGSAYAQHHAHGETAHDNSVQSYVLFNRLEGFDADHGTGLEWEAQAWIGTDTDKLWLRSEGERIDGRTEAARVDRASALRGVLRLRQDHLEGAGDRPVRSGEDVLDGGAVERHLRVPEREAAAVFGFGRHLRRPL